MRDKLNQKKILFYLYDNIKTHTHSRNHDDEKRSMTFVRKQKKTKNDDEKNYFFETKYLIMMINNLLFTRLKILFDKEK
jgi:hypothetical protein